MDETLYPGWGQRFEVLEVLAHERSAYQDIVIFQSASHGRVLMLDGCVQVTEADEFMYQEMIAHVPILEHGDARRVLVIGAGDGGVLRRVLQHPSIQQAIMVEIDGAVVRLAKTFLPGIAGAAWDDPRADVIIGDGIDFAARAPDSSFDVIIVDSTDPIGVGETLFTTEFYRDCARILTARGVIVNQAGVPFMQSDELEVTSARRAEAFPHVTAYLVAVPTYVGGLMALGFASKSALFQNAEPSVLRHRADAAGLVEQTSYWTPDVHHAAFQLPPYIARRLPRGPA